MSSGRDLRIVIVGAGFGGIATAIELRRHGFDDMREYEARTRVLDASHFAFVGVPDGDRAPQAEPARADTAPRAS